MTAMTSKELGISTPAEKAAAARRRDATKRVRWVRDKLTSTSGTPAFDYELLRQFAQNRQSASMAILLLIATVGFLSGLWTCPVLAGAWTLAAALVAALSFSFASTPSRAETRRAFLVGIERYSDGFIQRLDRTVNDAKDLAKAEFEMSQKKPDELLKARIDWAQVQAVGRFKEFIAGKTFDDYSADALLRSAVERQLMIVGEALNRLKKVEPTAASSITDARQIIAFRNILVHGYDMIRDEVVWGILETDLSTLTRDVESLLEQGEAEQTGGVAS